MSKTTKPAPEKKAASAKSQAKKETVKAPVKKAAVKKPAAKKVTPKPAKPAEPKFNLESLVAATVQVVKESPPKATEAIEAKGPQFQRDPEAKVSLGPEKIKEIPTALELRKAREVPVIDNSNTTKVSAKNLFSSKPASVEPQRKSSGFNFKYKN